MTVLPTARNVPSGLRTLDLGEHRLTYLPDGAIRLRPRVWFPEATDADWREYDDHLDDDGCLVASIGGLLVEHGGQAMLIDVGFGPTSVPARHPSAPLGRTDAGRLPESFADLGLDPASVGTVAFTHMHNDHVGWAVEPRGPLTGATFFVPAGEPVRGVREAHDGDEVFPGVTAWRTPGHTDTHTAYVISSGGQRVIAFGDLMHSPVQVAHPDWWAVADADQELALKARADLMTELTKPDTLGFGIHFADVVFGRVVADGSGHTWQHVSS